MAGVSGVYRDPSSGWWLVDKVFKGQRLRGRFRSRTEASDWLLQRNEELRKQHYFGMRPPLSFSAAADRYLSEKLEKRMPSVESDRYHLKAVLPYCGAQDVAEITDESLAKFWSDSERKGRSAKTICLSLAAVQAVLNSAEKRWRVPGTRLSVLDRAPKLSKPTLQGKQRQGRPITWEEQATLLRLLHPSLRAMIEFACHTGARVDVIINLRWEWLLPVDQFTFVFYVPKDHVKGRQRPQALILNSRARAIVDAQRGRHSECVFVWRRERTKDLDKPPSMPYRPVKSMSNTAWQKARLEAGLDGLHVHDLRHTFATRLAAAGVPESTIAVLLWHTPKSVTRRYIAPTLGVLQRAVELIAAPVEVSEDVSLERLLATRRAEARSSSTSEPDPKA